MSDRTLAIDVDDALIQEPRDGVFQDPPANVPPAPRPREAQDNGNLRATTTQNQEEHVRARAYELWEQRGCPSDSPEEDWFRAQSELMAGQG
jgi:hypothetical protein